MELTCPNFSTTRRAAVVLCTIIVLLAAVGAQTQTPVKKVGPQKAGAHSCSPVVGCAAVLSSDTTLCKNVGPCSGIPYAVYVEPGVVLKLNGYKIIGSNMSGSVGVEIGTGDTVAGGPATTDANGPGTITGFDTGILLDGESNNVVHVHLIANQTAMLSSVGGNTLLANTLKRNSCAGIVSSNGHDSIINNLITQSNAPPGSSCPAGGVGIYVNAGGGNLPTGVRGNAANHNSTGMYALSGAAGIGISGNNFSNNLLQGASVSGKNVTVTDNSFNSNGQDGLALDNLSGLKVQRNFAYGNKRWGIALTNVGGMILTDNTALGNAGYDLYETGSPGNTWGNDICDTGFSADGEFVCPFP